MNILGLDVDIRSVFIQTEVSVEYHLQLCFFLFLQI